MNSKISPPLRYPGSKWRIAEWIISYMPPHHSYVEPYFGSGAVFFNKPKSKIETVNDLDCDIVNLFSILRDNPDPLIKAIQMTPYARIEYDDAFDYQGEGDNIEKARRFLVRCWQGHGFRSNGNKVGWKNDIQGREAAYAVKNWNRLPLWLSGTIERLKEVQIENRPAVEVIKRFN